MRGGGGRRHDRLVRLPRNLAAGLSLLERCHFLRHGGKVPPARFPEMVLGLFNRLEQEKIDWVMVGAEALNLYLTRPRATLDVDIVVRQRHLGKATKVLREVCNELVDTEVHVRGVLSAEPNRLEVDMIKSQGHALLEAALQHRVFIENVPVPRLEALLALKYLSAVSPWRQRADKYIDIGDFLRASEDNRSRMDRTLLIDLASLAHQGSRQEFEKFLDDVENGRPLTI